EMPSHSLFSARFCPHPMLVQDLRKFQQVAGTRWYFDHCQGFFFVDRRRLCLCDVLRRHHCRQLCHILFRGFRLVFHRLLCVNFQYLFRGGRGLLVWFPFLRALRSLG